MKIVILVILASVALAQTVLVVSNANSAYIVSPINLHVGVEATHTAGQPNYLGNGAQWIWANSSDSWAAGTSETYQTLFFSDCYQEPAILSITAQSTFSAYLNGVLVATGSYPTISSISISLTCGQNNLTVVATVTAAATPAALIFSITQDQTNCYICNGNPGAYYNHTTCSCQCSSTCSCAAAQSWVAYPTCGCSCPTTLTCAAPLYLNQQTCSCQCFPLTCPTNYTQSAVTCDCKLNTCI